MNNTITVDTIINCSVTDVWNALTSPVAMKQWYFDIPDFSLKQGAVFNFYEPGGKNIYHHQCVVLEVIPEHLLKHTWTHPTHSKGTSTITWSIESLSDYSTKVTLIHEGVENFSDAGSNFNRESYEAGWKEIVGLSLKNFLETN